VIVSSHVLFGMLLLSMRVFLLILVIKPRKEHCKAFLLSNQYWLKPEYLLKITLLLNYLILNEFYTSLFVWKVINKVENIMIKTFYFDSIYKDSMITNNKYHLLLLNIYFATDVIADLYKILYFLKNKIIVYYFLLYLKMESIVH